jgi:hypothetical protein
MRIQYYAQPDYIFALLIDKNMDVAETQAMLERMYYLFSTKYRAHLGTAFDGEVGRFEDFADEIETIFNMKATRFHQFLETESERLKSEITELFDFKKTRKSRLKRLVGAWKKSGDTNPTNAF